MTKQFWIFEIANEWKDDKGVGVVWMLPNGNIQHGRYRTATSSEIDAAVGVTELRQRLEQYQTLIDTQQAVIIEQREELAGLKVYIAETEERGRRSKAECLCGAEREPV